MKVMEELENLFSFDIPVITEAVQAFHNEIVPRISRCHQEIVGGVYCFSFLVNEIHKINPIANLE